MKNLPSYIPVIFSTTVLITLLIFYWAIRSSDKRQNKTAFFVFIGLIVWLSIQSILTLNNVYNTNLDTIPPKLFLFGVLPATLAIVLCFVTKRGRKFVQQIDAKKLTFIHSVRIPVEFVLLWLYLHQAIPEIMTFEGWNFDIIAGITSLPILYFGYVKKVLAKSILLLWNIVGVILLTFIVVISTLAAPFPLQQLAFDQPNLGVLEYPFSLLPVFVVPLVMFSHFVSIHQLIRSNK